MNKRIPVATIDKRSSPELSYRPIPAPTLARRGIAEQVPPIVQDVLSNPGQSLSADVRRPFERNLGQDFSGVRIHADTRSAESADAVSARAYTVGKDVVFGHGIFQPHSPAGLPLLAHELTHVAQQSGASRSWTLQIDPDSRLETEARLNEPSGTKAPTSSVAGRMVLQRTPYVPSWHGSTAGYDRYQVGLTPISNITAVSSGVIPSQVVTATISAAGASHLSWELYDPTDKLIDGFSTVPGHPTSLTQPFTITDMIIKKSLIHGRFTLRCIARKSGSPLAYADQTFFVTTSKQIAAMDRTELGAVGAAPASHSLGEVGAAKARDMMLEHQESIAAGGTGTVQGNKCPAITPGVAQSDCTQYVYDILKYAFGTKGEGAKWKAVATEAARISGSGGLRGTALQTALESQAGWKGVFWAPSPRNPEDGTAEHPVAYKRVKKEGLYSKDDVAVDNRHSVVDYRSKSSTNAPTFTGLDQLKKVPLGVISARGGRHMTLIINGQVYEVHWDLPATDPNVIQATPLDKWQWESGVIVMPAADFATAFP